MKRPFFTVCNRRADPGLLDVRILLRQPPSGDQETGWRDVMKTFADLANSGAVSGSAISPSTSGCASHRVWFSGREVQCRFEGIVVDDCALTPLMNLCHWGHYNVASIEQIVAAWEHCSQRGDAEACFPKAWPHLSFEFTEFEMVGQPIVIDVEFRAEQSEELREEINDVLGYWFKAANWSGYADDHFPPPDSTVIVAPPVMTTDTLNVTWYLDEVRCSYGVFDGLRNCLERVNLTQAPIRRVTIGE